MQVMFKGLILLIAFKSLLTVSEELSMQVCPFVLDLAFLLDASGSVKKEGFEQMKRFVTNVTDYFDVSSSGTHIGVTKFSNDASVVVSFESDQQNKCYIKRQVLAMSYNKGGTYVDAGLKKTNRELFVKHGRNSHQATRVLLVITDGVSSRGVQSTESNARKLKDLGVFIIALGVGSTVNYRELKALASDPGDVYRMQSFSKLASKAVIEDIALTLCAAARRNGVLISRVLPEKTLVGHMKVRLEARDELACAQKCRRDKGCFSFNFSHRMGVCELNDVQASRFIKDLVTEPTWTCYELFV